MLSTHFEDKIVNWMSSKLKYFPLPKALFKRKDKPQNGIGIEYMQILYDKGLEYRIYKDS